MPDMIDIAFVGLGAIGLPMAASIARQGLSVTGIEVSAQGRQRATDAGIPARSSFDGVGGVDTIVVMVATGDQLASVVDSAIGLGLAGARWIVMSTVGPDAVRREASRILQVGGSVVDAPVSGGIRRAADGALTLFVSGRAEDVAAADPVLRAMGTPHVVGADVGDGQSVKVVNQHLCAVHIAAAAEALALAERLGLDPAAVLEVVGQGAAASFMLGDRGPRMLQGEAAPVLSQVGIFVKDTGLVSDAGREVSAELPILTAARERFLQAAERGLRTADDSQVLQTYRHDAPEAQA